MHYPITRTTIIAVIFVCLIPDSIQAITWKEYVERNGVPHVVNGVLFLSFQQLEDIDFADIDGIETVVELNLFSNKLQTLAGISQLINLKRLCLGRNKLQTLAGIGQFKNLEWLNLCSNELKSLPEEIGQLKNLRTLKLGSNVLQTLPEEIGELENLKGLYCEGIKLKSLPKGIGQLKNLICLSFEHNNLQSLPAEIGQLKNLEIIYLGDNNLRLLPPTYSRLPARTDYLDCWQIEELQEKFEKLRRFIIQAIKDNNAKNVRGFCRLRVEPWHLYLNDFKDEHGNNLLHLAVVYHDGKKDLEWKILKELIACYPGAVVRMLEEKKDRGEILLLQNEVGQAVLRKILELFTELQGKKTTSEMGGERE